MPKKSHPKSTNAANLEAKFDAGEDVLDYFDLRTAKVESPAKPGRSAAADRREPVGKLKRALEIATQIEKLGSELSSILGTQGVGTKRVVSRN